MSNEKALSFLKLVTNHAICWGMAEVAFSCAQLVLNPKTFFVEFLGEILQKVFSILLGLRET